MKNRTAPDFGISSGIWYLFGESINWILVEDLGRGEKKGGN